MRITEKSFDKKTKNDKKNVFLFLVKLAEQDNICSNSKTELEYFREKFKTNIYPWV